MAQPPASQQDYYWATGSGRSPAPPTSPRQEHIRKLYCHRQAGPTTFPALARMTTMMNGGWWAGDRKQRRRKLAR
jgi:hypothetical protein